MDVAALKDFGKSVPNQFTDAELALAGGT